MRLFKAHRLKLFLGSLPIRYVTVRRIACNESASVLLWTYDGFKGKVFQEKKNVVSEWREVRTTDTISPRVPIIVCIPIAHLNRSSSRAKMMDVTSGEEELTVQ